MAEPAGELPPLPPVVAEPPVNPEPPANSDPPEEPLAAPAAPKALCFLLSVDTTWSEI